MHKQEKLTTDTHEFLIYTDIYKVNLLLKTWYTHNSGYQLTICM